MANHGYLHTKIQLNNKDLERVARDIMKEYKFDSLELTYVSPENHYKGDKGAWYIGITDYEAVQFWISDELEYGLINDGKFIAYDEPKIISKDSVVEFRHGHGPDFMWWMEGCFMRGFQKEFGGECFDDGFDGAYEIKEYKTYQEYVESKGKKSELHIYFTNEALKYFPEQLKKDLNI